MEQKMFCYQCQETAGCKGCTMSGVCAVSYTHLCGAFGQKLTMPIQLFHTTNHLCKTVNFYQMMNALWIILVKMNHLPH